MNRVNIFLLGLSLLSITACTTKPLSWRADSNISALVYYEWVLQADAAALEAQLAWFADRATANDDAIAAVQEALVLSAVDNADAANDVRALELLAEATSSVAQLPSDYQVFVILWQQILNTRHEQRLAGQTIDALEQERKKLQRQIQALTSIEQQINRRETLRSGGQGI